MKKRLLIIIPIAVSALAIMVFFFILLLTHGKIIEQAKDYEPCSIASFDEAYFLNTQKVIDDKTGTYVNSNIIETETKAVLFECPDRYRAVDLKSIDWDRDTYDVIVVSGDVGTVVYKYHLWLPSPARSPG